MPGTVLSSLHSYSFNFVNSLMKLVLSSRTGTLERLSISFGDTLSMGTDLISKPMLLSTAVLSHSEGRTRTTVWKVKYRHVLLE